jgi:hypothetical protein
MSFYLESCVWPDVISPVCIKFCENLGSVTEALAMISQAVHSLLSSGQTEKVETSVEQSQEHAHHFL